jgi:hypothetical protein
MTFVTNRGSMRYRGFAPRETPSADSFFDSTSAAERVTYPEINDIDADIFTEDPVCGDPPFRSSNQTTYVVFRSMLPPLTVIVSVPLDRDHEPAEERGSTGLDHTASDAVSSV